MRVLVTGATGFVGGAVARRFLGEGEPVHVLVRDDADPVSLEGAGARVFRGSIADPNEIAAAATGCEVVVHAAAVASHRAAPRALAWVNVAGTENVLSAAKHVGCARVVYVSCSDVTLSNQDRVHWDEDRSLMGRPIDSHARSKLLAEELVIAFSAGGLEGTALRPGTLWGPGDTTTLPGLCREAPSSGVWLVGGGRNLVSPTYIENFVDAVVSACEVEAAAGRIYHVTDGEFIDAHEFFSAMCRAAGLPSPRGGLPYGVAYTVSRVRRALGMAGPWPTDVIRRGRSMVLDCQRAITELDYHPRVSLAEGMEALSEWVREVGGAEQVARMGRAPATAHSVDAQVEAAGGD